MGLDLLSDWVAGISYHVGICVPDMAEARRFYCDLLGFEEVWEAAGGGKDLEELTHISGVYEHCVQLVAPGGGRIELQAYQPLADGVAAINRQGLNHLSFGVKDVWAEYERLRDRGVTFRCPPKTVPAGEHAVSGYTFAYFDDPWGLTLELMGPPADRDDGERPGSGGAAAA